MENLVLSDEEITKLNEDAQSNDAADWDLFREDITEEDLNTINDKLVVFKLKDLVEWFNNFDRWWLEVNRNKNVACISREGIDYEPHLFGKIITIAKKEDELKNEN